MHLEVLIDELRERDRRRAPAGPEPPEHLLERLQRISTSSEPTDLRPRRAATLQPVPVRPRRLPATTLRFQLDHLALLDHLGTSSIDNELEELHPRRDDDHLSTGRSRRADRRRPAVAGSND